MSVFTHQVDCVKHLDFSYRGTAWVGQVTIVIADGKGAQSYEHKYKLINKGKPKKKKDFFFNIPTEPHLSELDDK